MTQGQPSGHLMPHLGHRRRSADEPRGLGGRVPALSGLSDDDPTVARGTKIMEIMKIHDFLIENESSPNRSPIVLSHSRDAYGPGNVRWTHLQPHGATSTTSEVGQVP